MPYRKVSWVEQIWYVIRWKFSNLRRRRWVYDFAMCSDPDELQETLLAINQSQYYLVGVTQFNGVYTVFIRRPADG